MERLIKPWFALACLSSFSSMVAHAATTDFTANITDGSCEVTIPNSTITFNTKAVPAFSSAMTAVELHHVNVELDCVNTAGFAPVLQVTGESIGLSDARLFRSGSSDAQGVGFMLKAGTVTDLSGFYTASGTLGPGDSVKISQDEGVSTQAFTVGLVRGADEAIPRGGAVRAKITFAFAYP